MEIIKKYSEEINDLKLEVDELSDVNNELFLEILDLRRTKEGLIAYIKKLRCINKEYEAEYQALREKAQNEINKLIDEINNNRYSIMNLSKTIQLHINEKIRLQRENQNLKYYIKGYERKASESD